MLVFDDFRHFSALLLSGSRCVDGDFRVSNCGKCREYLVVLAKRRFSMILDSVLHLFLSGSRCVDGDFTA